MIGQCFETISTQSGLIASLFMAGLLGGATHCAGMCGPFVMMQIGMKGDRQAQETLLTKICGAALFPYHLGRLTTYVTLAVVFHSLFNLAFFYGPLKAAVSATMLMLAGVVFLAAALPILGEILPWTQRLTLPMPRFLVTKIVRPLLSNTSLFQRYILGVALGFMPCGLVVAALLAAGTAQTTLGAGLAMGAFALGTMPALIMAGAGMTLVKARWPQTAHFVSVILMGVSGITLFVLAGKIIL